MERWRRAAGDIPLGGENEKGKEVKARSRSARPVNPLRLGFTKWAKEPKSHKGTKGNKTHSAPVLNPAVQCCFRLSEPDHGAVPG